MCLRLHPCTAVPYSMLIRHQLLENLVQFNSFTYQEYTHVKVQRTSTILMAWRVEPPEVYHTVKTDVVFVCASERDPYFGPKHLSVIWLIDFFLCLLPIILDQWTFLNWSNPTSWLDSRAGLEQADLLFWKWHCQLIRVLLLLKWSSRTNLFPFRFSCYTKNLCNGSKCWLTPEAYTL